MYWEALVVGTEYAYTGSRNTVESKAVPYSSTKQKQNCTSVSFCLCFVGFVIYVPTSCRQKQISTHIQQCRNDSLDCSWYCFCEDDNSRNDHPIVEVFDEERNSNGW